MLEHMTQNVDPSLEEVETAVSQVTPGEETQAEGSDPEETDAEDQNGESSEGTDEEADTKKEPVGFERRVRKLSNRLSEAEQEAAYWRRKAESTDRGREAQGEPASEPATKKPTLSEYNDVEAYAEAIADWTSQRAVAKVLEQERNREHGSRTVTTFQQRQAEFKKTTADFDEVIEEARDLQIPGDMTQAILESEQGPALQYYFAKNPDVVANLVRMPVHKRLMEVGKLEDKIGAPKSTQASSTPTKKTISSAPAPQKVVKANTVASTKDMSQMTPEEFIAFRNKTKGR